MAQSGYSQSLTVTVRKRHAQETFDDVLGGSIFSILINCNYNKLLLLLHLWQVITEEATVHQPTDIITLNITSQEIDVAGHTAVLHQLIMFPALEIYSSAGFYVPL